MQRPTPTVSKEYATFANALPVFVWCADAAGALTFHSEALHTFLNASHDSVGRCGWFDWIHPADRPAADGAWAKCVDTGIPYSVECRLRNAAGDYRWFAVRAVSRQVDDESPRQWQGVLTDVHDRSVEHDQHHLRQQSALLTAVVESSPAAIFAKGLDGRYILANPAMAQVWGRLPADVIGRADRELAGTDTASIFNESDQLALASGATVTREEVIVDRSERRQVFLVSKKRVESADGVIGVCGVAVDITEREHAQQQLRQAEERLTLALRAGKLGVWEWHFETDAIHWSAEAFEIVGIPRDSQPRTVQDFLNLVVETDRPALWQQVEAALVAGTPFNVEFRIAINDGQVRWLRNLGTFRRDPTGVVSGLIGTVQDITVLKTRDEELERSRAELHARAEELQLLLDAAPAAIWISHDPHGRTITGSRFAAELLRMGPGDNLSKSAADAPAHFVIRAHGRELRPEELPVQRASRGEEVRDFEEEVVFNDGSTVTLYGTALPLRDADGVARGAISAFVDVTGLKEAESRLRTAQATAEAANQLKDQFLATLSHELRTPLNAIIGYVSMLRSGVIAADRQGNALAIVERNAKTQLRLVEDLLDISRMTAGTLRLAMERLSVPELVGHSIDAVRPAATAKNLQVEVELNEDAPDVFGDRIRLQQVLWNLLNNAIKFSPRGGRVGLRVTYDAKTLRIAVWDAGDGIEPSFLPHVFEPFRHASRSGPEAGLGLGLTISKHLIELHGGSIAGASDGPGKGASFWVELPVLRG